MARIHPLDISKQIIDNSGTFKTATPRMQFALRGKPADYGLSRPFPDIAIGCGRQAIAPLMALKRAAPAVFSCYIQDPHVATDHFDVVIAPDHDGLIGPNVEPMIGAPGRITRDMIVKATVAFEDRLNTLPMPRIAMLIGGTSKSHKLTETQHRIHQDAALNAINQGYSLLITASRRTPDWVIADYAAMAAKYDNIWLYDGTGEDNPYFAFLGGAETILVTEDSTNMLTEACATGKPVFTLPMAGKAGKFQLLYDALRQRCNMMPYSGSFEAPTYAPLNETARIASHVWAHIDAKKATLN